MSRVLVKDNSESAILEAFTKTVNSGCDVTSIREKYVYMVEHLVKFYGQQEVFARLNKSQDMGVFAAYAASEVKKFVWNPKYTVEHLMRNFHNQSIIEECKAELSKLVNSQWVTYCLTFLESAQDWKSEFFVETEDRHMKILTPIKRSGRENVAIAQRLFAPTTAQFLFGRAVEFDADTEIDLFPELKRLRQLDSRDLLLPFEHGRLIEARANSNYISVVNMVFHANDVVNDIYTPDISAEVVQDFVNMGIQKLMEKTGKRHNRARNFVMHKTDMFRTNFHKYYRDYVNTGSMLSFMTAFIDDINASMKDESNPDDIVSDIGSFQSMIFSKLSNDPSFSQHRPMFDTFAKKMERNETVRNTKSLLQKVRTGD